MTITFYITLSTIYIVCLLAHHMLVGANTLIPEEISGALNGAFQLFDSQVSGGERVQGIAYLVQTPLFFGELLFNLISWRFVFLEGYPILDVVRAGLTFITGGAALIAIIKLLQRNI